MNNFRPISLLSIFDKIMEKLMHKRLYDFLENNNILFKNRFGFRKNNSAIKRTGGGGGGGGEFGRNTFWMVPSGNYNDITFMNFTCMFNSGF